MTHRDDKKVMPTDLRQKIRVGEWTGPLPSTREGVDSLRDLGAYARMNLVIVPEESAFNFMAFCQRNSRIFYISEVGDPGDFSVRHLAKDADIRTDLPRYRVYRRGDLIDEPFAIERYWRSDSVFFLIGSSSGFDWALLAANVSYRTLGAFETSFSCRPCGPFRGTAVVTARAFKSQDDAVRAIQISSRFPAFHGAPIHMGEPGAIGIKDLLQPEYPITGKQKPLEPNEVVMYWGCGILGKEICSRRDIPSLIVHYPGHLFLTDTLSLSLAHL